MKRWVSLVAFVVIAGIGITGLRNERSLTSAPPQPTVAVSSWGSGIGTVSPNSTTFDKQKLSFWASVDNLSNQTVYVTSVTVNLPHSLQSYVLSGSTRVVTNETLAPNATYKIRGHVILTITGMTKEQMLKLGNIKGFTVDAKY